MDDLTRVRELQATLPALTDRARATARARLHGAIVREGQGRAVFPLPRRLVVPLAVFVTTAAIVAGGVVVGQLSHRPPALSASQVLHNAALRARYQSTALPIPRDGQYFYLKTYTYRTYLADGRTRTWTDESWLSVDGSKPSRREQFGKVHDDAPLGEHQVQWPPTVYAELAKWPTDPDKLLNMVRFGDESTPTANAQAFLDLCLLMQGPRVMPPGLQAAAFEAVAEIPDVKLTDDVDPLGRDGIGVSYPRVSFTFLFDRETYDYLGLRTKGSSPQRVAGKWKQGNWYYETRSLEEVGVVDRIGQHP